MPKQPFTALEKLIILEWLFTTPSAILFPLAFLVLGKVAGTATMVMIIICFIDPLPANVTLNSLGYQTMEGHPQFLLPATSFEAVLALLLAHAALVGLVFFCWRGIVAAGRRAYRKLGFKATSDYGKQSEAKVDGDLP